MDKKNKNSYVEQFLKLNSTLAKLQNSNVVGLSNPMLPFSRTRMTPTQYMVMTAVYKKERNMTAIANACATSKASLTNVVNSLVKNGYVKRYQKDNNRRNVYAAITEKGAKLIYETHTQRDALLESKFAIFSEDEIAKLFDCYEYIIKVLERIGQDNGSENKIPPKSMKSSE